MSEVTILPTHTCFDDALEYVVGRVKQNPVLASGKELILVHGILLVPYGPDEGRPYAHAWVEESCWCWDCGILEGNKVFYAVAHDEFYFDRSVEQSTRYTILEAYEENRKHRTFGPWLREYKELCGGKRVFLPEIVEATV